MEITLGLKALKGALIKEEEAPFKERKCSHPSLLVPIKERNNNGKIVQKGLIKFLKGVQRGFGRLPFKRVFKVPKPLLEPSFLKNRWNLSFLGGEL